jgi:hypothetical protein
MYVGKHPMAHDRKGLNAIPPARFGGVASRGRRSGGFCAAGHLKTNRVSVTDAPSRGRQARSFSSQKAIS